MMTVETYLQKGRSLMRTWAAIGWIRALAEWLVWGLGGFVLSAAALAGTFQPVAMGAVSVLTGRKALAAALGSALGYRVFWGEGGLQGMLWSLLGWGLSVVLGLIRQENRTPLLEGTVAAFLVSAAGLLAQMVWKDTTPVPVYLLRILVAAGSGVLLSLVSGRREALTVWLTQAVAVLALAQVAPVPWLNLGYIAAGLLAAAGAFPAAALGGLALDLARVTRVPMTAVVCVSYLVRMIPFRAKWPRFGAPVAMYCAVMGLCGIWDPLPLAGLAVGGAGAFLLPPRPELSHRRGETGMAQVRLEIMAGVMAQSQQILMETSPPPIDEEAVLLRVRERACGGCPNRRQCRDVELPVEFLTCPPGDTTDLGIGCKKPGRMVLELRRGQEQLRHLQAERDRQRECREAMIQQYRFLGDYLRDQADLLPRRGYGARELYAPEVVARSAGKESANGDHCVWFRGTECRYYVLLCDGMGTGLGAYMEGQEAARMLRQLLTAGFPAEYALRSANSLLTLSGKAGAVTVDLAEIRLDTGRVTIYKWGAAPSWVLRGTGAEKIGTAGPPPGLSVTEARETVERLSLRRGETLILFSDGVDAPGALRREGVSSQASAGELAARLLPAAGEVGDDATVAVVRLSPAALST